MPSQNSRSKRWLFFFLFTGVFVVAIPIVILYAMGYSIDDTFSLTKRGGIYMYIAEPNTEVYVEDEHKRTTGIFQKEILMKDLKPDTYLVVVSNEKFQPWAKFLTVTPQEVVSAFPLLIPKEINVEEILAATSSATSTVLTEYQKIGALFKPQPVVIAGSKATTTSLATTTVIRKKITVWSEDGAVFAKWGGNRLAAPPYFCKKEECEQVVTVFVPVGNVRHVDFYPGRDDAVIISFGDGIYAIEIDTREYQNFYPLFKGKSPDFRISNGNVYVKDGNFIGVMDLDV